MTASDSASVCVTKPVHAQDPENPRTSGTPNDQSTKSHHARSDWATSAHNPLNWSSARRWTIIVVLAITNFVAAMTTAYEPGLDQILHDFHAQEKDSLGALSISIYTLGYCIGPLIVAPVSEIYGRIWLLRVAYVVFPLTLIGCGASRSIGAFIASRAIMGFAGIVFLLLSAAIVPDIMPKERRGISMGAMLTGAGLSLGPIMGGYIVERTTWRWIFWACAITFGLLAAVGCYILTETYSPVLQRRVDQSGDDSETRAQASSATSQHNLHVSSPIKQLSARIIAIFKGPWVRPAQMLIQSPIVLLFAIYTTVTQGYLLLVFATLGLVYQDHYHFSPGASGLAYLGLAFGLTISQFTLGHLSDKHIARMAHLHGVHKPEDRLPPLLIGALIIPFSLLAYGWGTHTHWIVPILGSALFAVGYMCTYLPVMMYLIDTYTHV
ncbi:hypothetical protein N0V90_012327 [Kalmusia sp. IMI 367209]|nr:hypothetical protein N0V90_012327 [Kalmusia sp. IMI 367209]